MVQILSPGPRAYLLIPSMVPCDGAEQDNVQSDERDRAGLRRGMRRDGIHGIAHIQHQRSAEARRVTTERKISHHDRNTTIGSRPTAGSTTAAGPRASVTLTATCKWKEVKFTRSG